MSSGELSTTLARPAAAARRLTLAWHHAALTGILGLAAFLDFWRLDQNGWANEYYSAAVHSMLQSGHNFFFASFDSGGLVSVDKPPLALWLEAASAKVFGFDSFAILLPEALAGVAAVGVLYLLVSRFLGRVAGLIAALALAVSPVSVSVNRDNNPDALFALLLVLAAWALVRALEHGRLRWLLASAAFVGLAFNTKMLAALVVVPGLGLAYLVCAPVRWRRRLMQLLAAGGVLVAVSSAWILAVELTPASDRPYVGSTDDNSALSLALGYNGLGRVTGQDGGTSFGGGLGGAFSGLPGTWRLLNNALGDQGAWLLPLAIVGGAVAFAFALRGRRRAATGTLIAVGGWFVAAAAVFSYASGIIHTYYLSALAPAACALVGAGTVALWHAARRGGLWIAAPAAALMLTAWVQIDLLSRSTYVAWLRVPIALVVLLGLAGLAALAYESPRLARHRRRLATAVIATALGVLLVAPAAWSATTLREPVNGVFPGAGPNFVSGLGTTASAGFGGPGRGRFAPPTGMAQRGGFGGDSSEIAAAAAYAEANGGTTRFLLIVSSEQSAAAAILHSGKAVAAMGGFTGRETVLTGDLLSRLVQDGDARYFLLGGSGGPGPLGGSSNAAVSTIESVCTPVDSTSWSSGSSSATLYDCAGKTDELAG